MAKLLQYIHGLPPATKGLTAIYSIFSLATIIQRRHLEFTRPDDAVYTARMDPARYLVLRPGLIIAYPWTLVTTTLVEPNPVFAILGVAVLMTVGAFLERQWGTRHFAMFFGICALIPVMLTFSIVVMIFAATEGDDSRALFETSIVGLPSVVAGFAVALKQLISDYNIKVFRGAASFRVGTVAGVVVFVTPIIYTLLGQIANAIMVNVGFFVAFVYLRFYKYNGGVLGDRSEAFAFVTFLPEIIRPFAAVVLDRIYRLAVFLRLITSDEGYQQAVNVEAGEAVENIELAEQVHETESDSDRRRALANKALEARLETGSQKVK